MNNRLIKSNDAGGGACTNTVDLYNPFPDGGGVALYQLNGDATDVSGNYNGTATNVTYGAGQFGQAGVFNGSTSYITLPVTQSNDISISAWIKIEDLTRQHQIVSYDLGGVSADRCLQFRVEFDQTVSAYWFSGTKAQSTSSVSQGVWTHVVATWKDNGTQKIYFNGVEEDSNAATTRPNFPNLYAGKRNTGVNADDFLGSIDQVRIFSRALRPYEVEALYTEEYCTPTIVPSEHFNTVTYTGNGSTQSITGVGFEPDLVWIKPRSFADNHVLSDSVRGVNKSLASNTTSSENSLGITSFDSDGFSLPQWGNVTSNGNDFVAWNFKAGGAAVTNTDGTITSQVSANTEAGFSVVSYTGNGANGTVGHGLGVTPNIVLTKRRNSTSNWSFNGNFGGLIYGTNKLALNDTIGISADTNEVLAANSNNFTAGTSGAVGASGGTYIAYCFAEVEGFSNFGSYVGNGSTSGPTVVTGFEPAFVMIKGTSLASQWNILDNKRDTTNPATHRLFANLSNAEATGINALSFLENGFEINNSDAGFNGSGQSYIYMAFAADPTAVEPTLEDSFNTVLYTGNGGTNSITGVGFAPDFVWIKNRNTSNYHHLFDTVRGAQRRIYSNSTDSENNSTTTLTAFGSDGFTVSSDVDVNGNGNNLVAWNWKGAEIPAINSNGSIPSVVSANPAAGFSIVSYNSNGTAGSTIGHGLGSSPDMIIIKNRDDADKWAVYHSAIGGTKFLVLNETAAAVSSSAYWNNTNPNSNTFTVGLTSPVNSPNNEDYIAYCFAEVAGFSKFGSYTGVSGEKVVDDLGFEPAFVMVRFTGAGGRWIMVDNKRGDGGFNVMKRLDANDSAAESTNSVYGLTFTSNGFTIPAGATSNLNAAGNTYIYMAFANQF